MPLQIASTFIAWIVQSANGYVSKVNAATKHTIEIVCCWSPGAPGLFGQVAMRNKRKSKLRKK
jgi:hypothetical protein